MPNSQFPMSIRHEGCLNDKDDFGETMEFAKKF